MTKPTYEELEAQLDAAWKAYPSWGCIRGLGVPLSEVIENLVKDLADTKSECAAYDLIFNDIHNLVNLKKEKNS